MADLTDIIQVARR